MSAKMYYVLFTKILQGGDIASGTVLDIRCSQLEPPPPPPVLKGVGTFQTLSHLGGGGKKFLARKGINLKRGVDEEMGGLPLFYCFTVQSHLLCVWGKQGSLYYFSDLQYFELAMQDSHPCFYCTKTWYHLYISDPLCQCTKNVDCFI